MAKKKRYTAAELQAYDNAYGRQLSRKRKFLLSFEPGLFLAIIAAMMWLNPVISLIAFFAGYAYGYMSVMPKLVKTEYERDGLVQRHQMLSSLTQILLANKDTQPIAKSLEQTRRVLSGELADDLVSLNLVVLKHESTDSVHLAFKKLSDKYGDDMYFVQFLDQVESFALNGVIDDETLIKLNNQHTTLYEKTLAYDKIRQGAMSDARIMLSVVLGVGIMIEFVAVKMAKYEYFSKYFWHGMTGTVTGVMFIVMEVLIFKGFYKRYFDTSITTYNG